MRFTVSRVVSARAPRGSSVDRVAVTVGLSVSVRNLPWHDAQSLSLIAPGDGEYRTVIRTPVHTRQKSFDVRRHQIGRQGLRFDANTRVHDASCVDSSEDEWFIVRLVRAFRHATDHGTDADLLAGPRPATFFCGQT